MLNLSQVTDDSVCTEGQGKQVCGVCNCNGAFTGPECQSMEIGDHCKYVTLRPGADPGFGKGGGGHNLRAQSARAQNF